MGAEHISTRTQVNELTQDREGTAKLAVWEAIERAEKMAGEVCPPSECLAVVRLEAQHDTQREVNCTTGGDTYDRMRLGEDGEAYSQYGSTLTYVSVRMVPRDATLDRLALRTAEPARQLSQLLATPGVVKTRSVFETVRYGARCFQVPPMLLGAFLDGTGAATWPQAGSGGSA